MSPPARHHVRPTQRRFDWRALVGVALILVAAYSAGSTFRNGEELQQRAECQGRVNTQLVAALQVRDTANRGITEAQRQLVLARLTGTDTGMTPRQADEAYIRALDELQRTRDANPLGEVPGC